MPTAVTEHAILTVDYRTGQVAIATRTATTQANTPAYKATRDAVFVPDPAPQWGTAEAAAVIVPPAAGTSWWWRAAATLTIALTLATRQAGPAATAFRRLHALTRIGRRFPAATTAQTRTAVRAVRYASRWWPARVACLEESVAAALLLAARGRRACWRHGVTTDPIRLHAWLAGPDGRPVEEPPATGRYVPIFERPFSS